MDVCPVCGRSLVPFRAKLVCRTPDCGFMENCCDGGWMSRCSNRDPIRENEPGQSSVESSRTGSLPDDRLRR